MNRGFRLGSPIFSRRRRMWTITVLFRSRYFSPHTVSNSRSAEMTCPRFSHSIHRISNSMGVRVSSLS